ncbi:hypothetical protein BDL97_03G068000 [Sphagnum fallax]|nr:hypothetical protein BDL97_03G068000 [Sphagnum fallax]
MYLWHYTNFEIGIGLTGLGVLFSFLGIILFFDKGLLPMGNILFIARVTYNCLEVNLSFFLKRHNYKGSISFAVGFCLVLWGWAVVGMLVQAYGFIVLFR